MKKAMGSIGAKLNPPPATGAPKQREGVVDMFALATGMLVAMLGAAQLFIPLLAYPFTGFESGQATQVLGALWLTMGAVLAVGGMMRIRSLAIFAAEFITLTGLVTFVMLLLSKASYLSLGLFLAMSVMALVSSYLARLSDKAEMKRELRWAKEQMNQASAQAAETSGETA